MRYRLKVISKAVSTLMVGTAFFLAGCQMKPMVIEKPVVEDPFPGLYGAAKLDFQEGRYEDALVIFNKIISELPGHPETPVVEYDMARSYFHLGDLQRSVSMSLEWIDQYPENHLKGDVCLLLANSYSTLEDGPETFQWLVNSVQSLSRGYILSEGLEAVESRIVDLINISPAQDLEEMAKYDTDNIFTPLIYNRLINIFLEEDRLIEARDSAMLLVRSSQEQSWVNTGRAFLEKINKRIENESNVRRNAIGCLLPLTGPYALYGQDLLNGIQLGMDIFGKSENDQGMELIIRNTNGTEEDTVSGLEELVDNEKVMVIIGPLASGPVTAAVKKAQELGVPIISFTQKTGITDEGDMVFRNFLTPSKEVEALLNRSINEMGMERFGIFYPDSPYGRFLMNTFWDRAEEMGGTITAVESYKAEDTDFEVGIKKMVGLYYPRPESVTRMLEEMKLMEAEQRAMELYAERSDEGEYSLNEIFTKAEDLEPFDITWDIIGLKDPLIEGIEEIDEMADKAIEEEDEEPEPIVDFDAVFIPDSYQRVALIAPQFPFYNVFNVPFLGTSLWQSDELVETTGNYVQGAIFPSGFFIGVDSEFVKKFVESFRNNFKSDPGDLAANGYDTIRFIRDILENDRIKTRMDFLQEMYEKDSFHGVTGEISFDSQGEVEKDPFLLTIYGRRLHLLQ